MAYGYGRYFRRGWWRSGVARSQTSGTRRFNLSVPIEDTIAVPLLNQSNRSWTFAFSPFGTVDIANTYDTWYGFLGSLLTSNLYNTYCRLYDQVKINSVSVQLSVLSIPAGTAVKVYTSVDREANFDELRARPSHANILSGAETMSTQFTSLDRSIVRRYLKARDLQERTKFLDSTSATYPIAQTQTLPAYNVAANVDWYQHVQSFAPAIYGFLELSKKAEAYPASVTFAYKVRWNVTFRNPKFSIAGAQNKLASFERQIGEFVEDARGDGDEETEEKTDEMKDEKEEAPVLKKKKVVYEEEVLPDDEEEEEDESQEPLTQPFRSPMKKAGKKV